MFPHWVWRRLAIRPFLCIITWLLIFCNAPNFNSCICVFITTVAPNLCMFFTQFFYLFLSSWKVDDKKFIVVVKMTLECTAMKDMKFTHSHRGHGTYFCIWVRIWFSVFVIDILVGAMTHHPAVKWQLRHCSVIIALRNFVLSSTLKSSRQKSSTISANIFDKLSK